MTGGAEKRPSENGVFADTKKKKKISKEKCAVDPPKETSSNGDLRQKKAFFAYFGKSFVENKNGNSNCDANKANTIEIIKFTPTKYLNADESSVCSDEKAEKKDISIPCSDSINTCLIEKNSNLSYVSRFIEDLSCFPKITHANRLAPLNSSDLMVHLNEETFHNNDVKSSTLLFQTYNPIPERLILEPYLMELDLPFMISSLKKSVPNFPVLQFHKHIKKKYLDANKSVTDIELMWIDKFKPTCKEEVLGNSEVIKGLKKWLRPDKTNFKKAKKNRKYDDDDDFIFNSDSDSSCKAQHNLAILLGPSGCGKTSAVYAVANELNANVIEVNASCNRNGKRIISELMEATQSHAVEKNCLLSMMKGKKKNAKNSKNKKDVIEKMTIILIEDADILFDNYDDGFLSAISTLASDSKRPLVLTANDPFSIHLLKFVLSNEMIFNFVHPPKEDLNCFLQLMALNEGVIMSEDDINAFVHPFKPDIRQSILQLQYILKTGEIDKKCIYRRNINSIWWDWPYEIGCNLASIETENQVKCNFDMASISLNLDTISKLNLIHSKTQGYDFLDAQPFWNHLTARDSASLVETHDWSDYSIQLSTDITHWIYDHISTKDRASEKLYPSSKDLSRRQRIWNTSKDILMQIGLDYCNRKNETCFDYLATIRSLSKNQQLNQPFGNLRHSKMFSYLRRINIDVDCKDLKFFCDSLHSESNCNLELEISDQF